MRYLFLHPTHYKASLELVEQLVFLLCIVLGATASGGPPLGPGTYAVSLVGTNPCQGYYLAYDTNGTRNSVYLIPSTTSHPPMWRVTLAPDGTNSFTLTALNRTVGAPNILIYDPVSCNYNEVILGYRSYGTWDKSDDLLSANHRECPPGSATTLAPVAIDGKYCCRAVHLIRTPSPLNYSDSTWHFDQLFNEWPAGPLELYAANGPEFIAGAESLSMKDDLLVMANAGLSSFWQRSANGAWLRGTIKHPSAQTENMKLAIGDSFVAFSMGEMNSDTNTVHQSVHIYEKSKLGGRPTAVVNGIRGYVLLAAGGNNLAVAKHPNSIFMYSRGRDGRWGQTAKLDTPKRIYDIRMSRGGRRLAVLLTKNDRDKNGSDKHRMCKVLLFRQVKPGGAWEREVELHPPQDGMGATWFPQMFLDEDNLILAFYLNETNPTMYFYRHTPTDVWVLAQQEAGLGNVFYMTGHRDTIVTIFQPLNLWYVDHRLCVYRRSNETGQWTRGEVHAQPRWDDDFLHTGYPSEGYGPIAMHGQRLALPRTFHNSEPPRQAGQVIFLYENIDHF